MNTTLVTDGVSFPELLQGMRTNTRKSVWDMSVQQPVLLVFLRHFGCTFCREALSDISKTQEMLEGKGVKIVFVHMSSRQVAERYFSRYNIQNPVYISDPSCKFYTEFGLLKGNFTQLFGLHSWIRGFQSSTLDGHGIGTKLGDGFQMPGIFVIQDGLLKNSYIHKLASDRPNYKELLECCTV